MEQSGVLKYQGTLANQVKGEIGRLESELDQLLDKEEIIWSQHSKEPWLRDGDCNTKYFHSKVFARHKKNEILGLKDDIELLVYRLGRD